MDAPVPFGGGHINDTYLFSPAGEKGVRYVLQRINKLRLSAPGGRDGQHAPGDEHLREQIVLRGGDPQRETLRLLRTRDGLSLRGPQRGLLALLQLCQRLRQLRPQRGRRDLPRVGRAFGRFLRMLDGFDAASLHETIERFHDTPHRFAALNEAVARDAAGRAEGVRDLIALALSYEPFASTLVDALAWAGCRFA